MSGLAFWEGLSEGIGFKTGLVLDRGELLTLMAQDERFTDWAELPADEEHGRRFESVEYEELFFFLLFKLGQLEREQRPLPVAELSRKYRDDRTKAPLIHPVAELFIDFGKKIEWEKVERAIDPSPFIRAAFEHFGLPGLDIAMEMLAAANASVVGSPWSKAREIDWADEVALRDLFKSEGLGAPDGAFVEQRYIDFLHRNFERIDQINWRKFEGLTGDFFQREGYRVELGPGRNDGGVDLRIWSGEVEPGLPPTILVQCKRQKTPVERVVMKALYADILHEGADSGLIVTTSRISPGAGDDRTARGYPIESANRGTLRTWIESMRKPGAGFLP